MASRIPGEFVQLNLNLPSDPKIRRAGPDAARLGVTRHAIHKHMRRARQAD